MGSFSIPLHFLKIYFSTNDTYIKVDIFQVGGNFYNEGWFIHFFIVAFLCLLSFSPKVLAISHLADVSNKNTQEFSSKCFSCLLNSFNTRLFPSVHLIKFVRQLTLLISTAITVSVLTLNRSSCKCTCYFFISCAQTSDWSSSKAGFISEVISKLTSIITIQFGFPFLSAQRSQKTTTSIMCYL